MPLVPYSLRTVQHLLQTIDKDPARLGRILCLAHPDIIATPKDLQRIFGNVGIGLPIRPDSDATLAWHKQPHVTKVPDTEALLKALGYDMTVFDVTEARGGEIAHDMNEELPSEFYGKFDFAYDNISHQVFNIGECWRSLLDAVRVGGYILSVTPLNAANNGFWNVSPTAYHDFYGANGATIVSRQCVLGFYEARGELLLDPVKRCRNVPDDAVNVVVIRKDDELTGPPDIPIMTKFRKYPTSQR